MDRQTSGASERGMTGPRRTKDERDEGEGGDGVVEGEGGTRGLNSHGAAGC